MRLTPEREKEIRNYAKSAQLPHYDDTPSAIACSLISEIDALREENKTFHKWIDQEDVLTQERDRMREDLKRAEHDLKMLDLGTNAVIQERDRLRKALEPFTELKTRIDSNGEFYKRTDVSPLIEAAKEVLK
jgi:hypothetical protein